MVGTCSATLGGGCVRLGGGCVRFLVELGAVC